jgi:hypothetical protein
MMVFFIFRRLQVILDIGQRRPVKRQVAEMRIQLLLQVGRWFTCNKHQAFSIQYKNVYRSYQFIALQLVIIQG